MPLDDRTKTLLRQIELFSDLGLEEISAVAQHVALREFQKGEVIFHAEDTNKFMYAVLRGEVKVFQTTEEGKEAILAFHCTGDTFGELSLIDQLANPATVCAMETSIVAIIARHDFMEIIHNNPKVLNKLLLTLTTRLRNAWDQNRMLHFKDATRRIRTLLCNLAETRGQRQHEDVVVDMRLTHQLIADMTGLTSETVTRVLDKWKREGQIDTDHNRHLVIKKVFFEENGIV